MGVAEHGLSDEAAGAEAALEVEDILDTAEAGGHVVRGGSLRIATYVVSILFSVLGAALLLRHLSVGDFGRYTLVFSLVTIVGVLTDLGLTGVGVRQSAAGDEQARERIMRNLLGIRLSASVIGLLAAVGFSAIVGYPPVVIGGIAVAGVGLLMLVTVDSYTIPLQVRLRFGWIAAIEAIRQITQTLTVIVLVVIGAGLLTFTGVQIPGVAITLVVSALLIRGSSRLSPAFDLAMWRHMAKELLPFAAASAIGAVYFRVEIVVLALVSSAHQTGLFSGAFRVTEVVVGIPWLVASTALPLIARAAEHDRERLRYALGRMFEASLALGLGIALAIFLGAEFGLKVLAGPKYAGSVDVLKIQAATVAFTFFVTQWGFALLAIKRTVALLVVNALALLVAVALTVALGSSFGAKGASVAVVSAEALLAVGYAISLARADGDLRPRAGTAPRVLLAGAVAIAAALASGLASLPSTLLGVAVYAGLLVLLGAMPHELRELLPGRTREG